MPEENWTSHTVKILIMKGILIFYVHNRFKIYYYVIISNRLTLNINKTCYMLFNNKLSHINISINNINLTRVKSIEFVGIIDQNLDWKLHILYLKNKFKKIIWITNIISKFVNQKALLPFFYYILIIA